ncbi:MAG: hypothetical protein Q8N51_10480, partial [Gammaproteobacteria bacterium]|nr:hypothetical protein [Gammaproteobacteria bacterium]
MSVLVALCVALAVAAGAYVASRMRLSLAPFTISVDFFQILGRQATVDVPWGKATKAGLQWTAMFDFDLQLMAPECVVKVGYSVTWFIVNLAPIAALVVLAIWHASKHVQGVRGQRVQFLSRFFIICQLGYMVLVLKALAAIDCMRLPDGRYVLEANPQMECWTSEEHMPLMVGGGVAIAVYVIGILVVFNAAILAAQKEAGSGARLGRTAFWQQSTTVLSARFVPEHPRWVLIIMTRKMLIAAGVVMQSGRPVLP